MGGLGIRRASSLALPAFLASAASTLPLQTLILTSINLIPDKHFQDMTSEWCSKSDFNDGDSMPTHKQALWDRPLLQHTFKTLFQDTADPYNTARLKAVSSPHASGWLYALPITACGLKLEDEDVRVAVGLRLGGALCEAHKVGCGGPIDARGSHGLSCILSRFRQNPSTQHHQRHHTPLSFQGRHPIDLWLRLFLGLNNTKGIIIK